MFQNINLNNYKNPLEKKKFKIRKYKSIAEEVPNFMCVKIQNLLSKRLASEVKINALTKLQLNLGVNIKNVKI